MSDVSRPIIDIDREIRNQNHGKVIGMTTSEWDKKVERDYQQWTY